MRRHHLTPLRAALLAAAVALLAPLAMTTTTSCSVAAWGVGSALTRDEPSRRVPAGRALELHPGTRLGLVLPDSSLRRGTFVGRVRLEPVVYRARFDGWRAEAGIALSLGDEVEVTFRDRRVRRGRFAGFAHRAVLLEREDGAGFVEVRDRDIEWFAMRDSVGWSGEQLAEADTHGAFPTREAILFRPAPEGAGPDWYNTGRPEPSLAEVHLANSLTIPCDDLEAVEIAGPRNARTVLFVAGLAVDAILVVAASPSVSATGSGCAYQNDRAAQLQPNAEFTSLAYDVHWGEFVPEAARTAGAGAAPGVTRP